MKLIGGTNRITLDNTLDERLRLLEDRVRCPRHASQHLFMSYISRCCQKFGTTSSAQTQIASSTHELPYLYFSGRRQDSTHHHALYVIAYSKFWKWDGSNTQTYH